MRRDPERDELRLLTPECFDAIFQLTHRDIRLRWVGSEDFLVHDAAHARFAHCLHRDATRASVGVSSNPSLEPFDDAEASGVEERFLIHDLVAALSQPVDPMRASTILEEAAHSSELAVRVRVD